SIPEGAIGLIGPNGAGKTTLLRVLMGLIEPTTGRASVLGQDTALHGLSIRERVGYMPEDDCLLPEMSGVGFVAYMGRVTGLPKELAFRRAHEVLQFTGLKEERYRKIAEYSGGMRQRVKLAQALVHDPTLCILDEPTAGLDPAGREGMLGLLRILASRPGRSMVLSTHLLGDVERVCDQVLMLNAGRLLAVGPLADLKRTGVDEIVVRIKGDPEAFVAALQRRGVPARIFRSEVRIDRPPQAERVVFEAAREAGVQVRSLGPGVRTMEELFLRLVQSVPPGRPT
ncbi:MAG: ABC transporter ATP-binding protein, partial [Thermoplasmata archaeon]|nr:ABC transporter ATP-binding protein [Thermoplasmata archaeon]